VRSRLDYPEVCHQIQRIQFDGLGGMEYSFVMSAEETTKNRTHHVGEGIRRFQADRSPVRLFRLGPTPLIHPHDSQDGVKHD
jgi:hypothetical protein